MSVSANQSNKTDILSFIEEGEMFTLPNGKVLTLNLPTVSDLTAFTAKSERLAKKRDAKSLEELAAIPIEMLQSVTSGYNFTADQCLALYTKCGGVNGELAHKVYSLYGIELKPQSDKKETAKAENSENPIESQQQ